MITYKELAWLWMSASGTNSNETQRRDFDKHTIDYLADECLEAWDEEPPLDREKLINALGDYRSQLEQAGEKPGDPP